MAEQHISRAERLASMSEHGFLASYGQVFRALRYLEGSASDNATKIFELHQRYGRTVLAVVNNAMQTNTSTLLPASFCLSVKEFAKGLRSVAATSSQNAPREDAR